MVMANQGWLCPLCGGAHPPHLNSCPHSYSDTGYKKSKDPDIIPADPLRPKSFVVANVGSNTQPVPQPTGLSYGASNETYTMGNGVTFGCYSLQPYTTISAYHNGRITPDSINRANKEFWDGQNHKRD